MKKIKKYLALESIVLLFASCSVISDLAVFDSGTATSSANFKYVKTVQGEATSTYFLGLGGGNNAQRAMDNLKKNANLKENQALKNVSIVKKTRYSLFITRTVTITADVIVFVPDYESKINNPGETSQKEKTITETPSKTEIKLDQIEELGDNIDETPQEEIIVNELLGETEMRLMQIEALRDNKRITEETYQKMRHDIIYGQ